MFKLIVDDEINLYLVNEAFTGRYVELAEENKEYLSEWLAWPRFCTTQDDFSEFVKDSLHKYADGRAMRCVIEYHGEIVGQCWIQYHKPEPEKGRNWLLDWQTISR